MGEEEEEEVWVGKDKVLVQTSGKRRSSHFLIFDLKNDKLDKKVEGCGILWNHSNPDGLIVVDDSVVYAMGSLYDDDDEDEDDMYSSLTPSLPDDDDYGDYHFHSGASFLDLTEEEEDTNSRWMDIGKTMMLNCNRSFPACASLGDKIFVFGGSIITRDYAFGEFYDRKKYCWEAIPLPPIDHKLFSMRSPVISDPKRNRLLCHFSTIRSLYAYYPDNHHQWVCLDSHMSSWRGQPAPVPIDDVLYFIYDSYDSCDNEITAYDIQTNKPLHVSWWSSSSSSPPFDNRQFREQRFTNMLYLGNNILCLPTISYLNIIGSNYAEDALYEFYRFKVCRTSHEQVLLTPLSLHRILIQEEGFKSPINTLAL